MTPYEQTVTILARVALLITVALIVGCWFAAFGLRCFYSFRLWRRERRRRGYVGRT